MQLYVISKFQIKVDITFFLSFGLASSSTVSDRGSGVLSSLVEILPEHLTYFISDFKHLLPPLQIPPTWF